ncbi:BofC C-terminal domain-containing protein [Scopulibacillus cellulosilyticus]|uniref:BofC C-terminal domain-containing protein n=1 Tax=Scopulibacillus cellulosilyticus TaxID=2665665 RepID=A0ABW2PV07_9BACL
MIKLLFSLLFTSGLFFFDLNGNYSHLAQAEQSKSNMTHLQKTPVVVYVHLKKDYLDGISIERTVEEHPLSLKDIFLSYQDWQLVKQTNDNIYFEKRVNDISPVAKTVGIFGLTNDRTLTIFEGNPDKNQIIQTFFQIDTKALEANEVKDLNKGIPVRNKKHFQQVMNALAKYAEKHSSGHS